MNGDLLTPYARIDYYSCILYDTSLAKIFSKFDIDYRSGSDFPFVVDDSSQVSVRQVVYRVDYFRIVVNLIDHRLTAIQTKSMYPFMSASEKVSFFNTEFPSVKIEAAGQELNYLRRAGFNVEEMFMNRLFWASVTSEFKVTRCDFAFDFIDHPRQPEFPQELSRFLAKMQLADNLRLTTSNKKQSGLVYKIERNPKGCCCYLGSQTSSEFVRVYDKLQEQAEKNYKTYDTSMWPEDAEFRNCSSWTRIELQTRREKSARALFAEGTTEQKLLSLLKHVFDNYMVTDPDTDHKPEPFISEYFDPSQIQNLNFVQFEELGKYKFGDGILLSLQRFVEKNSSTLITYLSVYGLDKLVDELNGLLKVYYTSHDALAKHRLLSLSVKISEALQALDLSFDDQIGTIVDENGFRFLKSCTYSVISDGGD